jgi:hypothetical protein
MRRRWLVVSVLLAGAVGCDVILGIDAGHSLCDGMAEGTPLAEQTIGDCADIVCGADGRTRLVPAPGDLPDDLNPCTNDGCDGTAPVHEPIEGGSAPCYDGPAGTMEVGSCRPGTVECVDGEVLGACEGQVLPGTETCDVAKGTRTATVR